MTNYTPADFKAALDAIDVHYGKNGTYDKTQESHFSHLAAVLLVNSEIIRHALSALADEAWVLVPKAWVLVPKEIWEKDDDK